MCLFDLKPTNRYTAEAKQCTDTEQRNSRVTKVLSPLGHLSWKLTTDYKNAAAAEESGPRLSKTTLPPIGGLERLEAQSLVLLPGFPLRAHSTPPSYLAPVCNAFCRVSPVCAQDPLGMRCLVLRDSNALTSCATTLKVGTAGSRLLSHSALLLTGWHP